MCVYDNNILHILFECDSVMKANNQNHPASFWVPELCYSVLLLRNTDFRQ